MNLKSNHNFIEFCSSNQSIDSINHNDEQNFKFFDQDYDKIPNNININLPSLSSIDT
jgi:hypothetical protein